MNKKIIKYFNIIVISFLVLCVIFFAIDRYKQNQKDEFNNKCLEFKEIIENYHFNDLDYNIDVFSTDGDDKIHLVVNIFNYEEEMKDHFNDIYQIIEKEFNNYDFGHDYNQMQIDIMNSKHYDDDGIEGHAVDVKIINK